MSQSRLDLLIQAKNNASPALKQVASAVRDLDSAAGMMSKGLSGLATGAGIAGIVALGAAAVKTVSDLAEVGAQAERVGNAFDTLSGQAGENAASMLSAMREASRGTIADTELMLAANRAMMLGVADSAEEMSKLLEIASARGKAMGLSTAQAFNDIVTGLGRGSALILDNLGIVVDAASANEEYAASIGKAASALTDAEKKQALINQVLADSEGLLADSAGSMDDSAAAAERMAASWGNLRAAIGESIAPTVAESQNAIAGMMDTLTDWIGGETALRQQIDDNKARIAQYQSSIRMYGDESGAVAEKVRLLEAQTAQLSAQLLTLTGFLEQSTGSAESWGMAVDSAGNSADAAAPKFINAGLAAQVAAEGFREAYAASMGIQGQIDRAAAGMGAFVAGKEGGDAGLAKYKAVGAELEAQRKTWEDMGYTTKEIDEVLLPGMISSMNEADRAAYRTVSTVAKIAPEVKEAQRAFDELKGKVEGVLNAALDPGVGVDPDKILESLGLRPDAINEQARRLADIAVNGLTDQSWLDDFKQRSPDVWAALAEAQNPQAAAAQMLKDFQDGLRPDLIDKGMATDLVRRMLTGEKNLSELAQEIAEELSAEMGRSVGDVLSTAQRALGVGDTNQAGGDAGETFTSGMQGELDGASIVDTVVTQMRAVYTRIQTAGRDAGETWGVGFLEVVGDNVPPALVKLLTDLTTPGVMANIARQNTQMGAAQ